MIKSIHFNNFKCLSDQCIDLQQLTVFCGQNNVGKSSCIQGFLLANEVARMSRISGEKNAVSLNNIQGYDLGTLADILSDQPDSHDITLTINSETEDEECEIIFEATQERLDDAFLFASTIGFLPKAFGSFVPRSFTYLSAERWGPRDTLPLQSQPGNMMEIGSSGQYVAEMLQEFERSKIREDLRFPLSLKMETLQLQVEAWMDQWIPDLQLRAQKYENASVAAVRFGRKSIKSNWKRPSNIGFGVSYSLPIVVSGLLAPKESILIVDTPEAHLHPAGQSAIGGFLARVAASGVQVLVETHSDHVINGIRLAVASPGHPITSSQVLINNFERGERDPVVHKINIDKLGGLTNWPNGFLDQIEQDLAKISRFVSTHKPLV